MKKSHRVAHEKSEAWWVLLILLYRFYCDCQDCFFRKKEEFLLFCAVLLLHRTVAKGLHYQLPIYQLTQHNFFCTIENIIHFPNPFPLAIFLHFLSYRFSFLHLTDNDL